MRTMLAAIVALGGAGVAAPALAHAFLDHAVPAVGSTVAPAPQQILMFFTEELEPSFCGATLMTGEGQPVATRGASVDPHDPTELVLTIPALAPGKYKVEWRVVSTDTHRTEGSFTFEVRP